MKKVINIEGLVCNNCEKHVKNALMDVSGVLDVDVDRTSKIAEVTLAVEVSDEILKSTVEEAGYEVNGIQRL